MVNLTINGRIVQAKEGEMLLTVLRREKIDVPALCHHEAVEPFGACRLCTVEITKEDWNGYSNYVTSCLYPVEEGLIVSTHSPKVNELRKTILDLFLARHPNSPEIRQLAADYGVFKTSYETVVDGNNCILCAICTRICDTMGFHAISTVGRGHGKEVAPPLHQVPPDCVGCLACALNCPTHYIEYTFDNNYLTIWDKKFELMVCSRCGKKTITKEFAEYLSKHRDIPFSYFEICDECHRKELAATMGQITSWEREA
ncbi:MAG: 2Fe-2S iron-sulfur cluster binding domain-containing protein [FCB group bacterium]|nr:2Fe-2S iron-sulfur cluster binding domain-containing protein [FCB group bacterium]